MSESCGPLLRVERALLSALAQGLTSKTKASLEAYRALRETGGWVPRETVDLAWARLVREGRIARTGRTWHIVEVTRC